MPMTGLEPGTFRLQGECSNQLSYIGCMFESLKLVFVFKTCPLLLNFLVMEVECKYFQNRNFIKTIELRKSTDCAKKTNKQFKNERNN